MNAVVCTRRNAWDNGGTLEGNDALLWYARGVGVMQARALSEDNSWWFFAAIHGEYIDEDTEFPGWGFIPGPPQVPTAPKPSASVAARFWNQCQHQSWYFPPWHRGYLIALEAHIREAVIGLGGPANWALPYWNYFGPGNQHEMPPAFAQQTLPDGSPNPLLVEARYGPMDDKNIFIPIPPVSQACQSNDRYTGTSPATLAPGYGGPETSFWHGGGTSGNLESNPHNQVHVDIGGVLSNQAWGLMSDPGLAALDPTFYLHHCNIDRMWALWNAAGNGNPTKASWLNGPAASGDREFVMPMPGGTEWVFTPSDVKDLNALNYTYDDLTVVPAPPVLTVLSRRIRRLGASPGAGTQGGTVASRDDSELVGANETALAITSSGARTTVRLDREVGQRVSESLASASEVSPPDQIYLQLEDVRGTRDAQKLAVYVNDREVGTVALFGLRRASDSDGRHGGGGLTFVLDITNIVDDMFVDNSLDTDSLDVRITPTKAVPEGANISVGRISVYRQPIR